MPIEQVMVAFDYRMERIEAAISRGTIDPSDAQGEYDALLRWAYAQNPDFSEFA